MQNTTVPFCKTGYFSQLMLDYIAQKPSLKSLYNRFPATAEFEAQIAEKAAFNINRDVLVSSLKNQYSKLYKFDFANEVLPQIELLKESNTFTITTGHQLNLFTGPLYFVYKIANVIKLTLDLKEAYPQHNFVPVFWMATEDHDFAEINHIHLNGRKISWNRKTGGAVGQMDLQGIDKVLEELELRMPKGQRTTQLLSLFKAGYTQHNNLADAMRYIVNGLFGAHGLVILDGDDHNLKSLMISAFKRELLESTAEKNISQSNQKLEELGYKIQVNPREINLFLLEKDYRERIVKTESGFATADEKYSFSEKEMLSILENSPEKISPNVTLRPLYQESILPNLAYVGGGGEMAYWLQLKQMFHAFEVPFPMLRLRNSVGFVEKRIARKMEKLELSSEEIFIKENQLTKKIVQKLCSIDEQIEPLRKEWKSTLSKWADLAKGFDSSLISATEAQRAKVEKGMLQLERKMLRSAKRKESDKVRMVSEIKNSLFPGGGLQERHDNIAWLFNAFGEEFIPFLIENIDPLAYDFSLFMED